MALVALGVCALTLVAAAGSAQAVLIKDGAFGGTGSGAGQLQTPVGVGVNQSNGDVWVADSGNARVSEFNLFGGFVAAWGWGVADGKAQFEVCTSNCQAGIPGSGVAQFSNPTSVAVDSSGGASNGDVYVGDAVNNVVDKFDSSGHLLSSINGSTTPQGNFSSLVGVAVDQSGNLWTADASSDNITEFDDTGAFLQQWNDGFGTTVAMTADSTDGLVYAIRGAGTTVSFSLTGSSVNSAVDNGRGNALTLDPKTGNVYVDHGGDVAVYNKNAVEIDSAAFAGSNSQGMAFQTIFGGLYVSDASQNNVTVYGPPTTPAAPLISGGSATNVTTSAATLNSSVFPFGLDTTCTFQYVDEATFQSSGYANATSVPCVPADLGSSISAFQNASADIAGLAQATTYHFRVIAVNSKGTVAGPDSTLTTQGPPAVSAQPASGVTDVVATANGTVNPTGLDTTCTFQYVSDATFRSSGYNGAPSVPCSGLFSPSGFTDQLVSGNVTGLSPATTYHFRVVATNSAGTANSPDTTFTTHKSFLVGVSGFGSTGSGGGQLQTPVGVGVDQSTGAVYVADNGNARLERFNASGGFVSAFGWGVRDGVARLEVCTGVGRCKAGIPGSGAGQFQSPTGVAVDSSTSSSAGDVYVADPGNNVVDKFDPAGHLLRVFTGAGTPQGNFIGLSGVGVDQQGNLWTTDRATGNVTEYSPTGSFLQQWRDPLGAQAIAVDQVDGAAYVNDDHGSTQRFSLTGTAGAFVDGNNGGNGVAVSLDPNTGNLYVDHGSDVAVYDHNGTTVDHVWSLGTTTGSQGLAFRSRSGNASRLYLADAGNNKVAIFGPPAAGAPFISDESADVTARTTATLSTAIVSFSHNASCTLQYVDDATFMTSGYTNATSVRCTPSSVGSSFGYQTASANIGGLVPDGIYHFRVVSTSSAGTTTGADQTFQQPPANWPDVDRCPVDDPAMLPTDGVNSFTTCVVANSTNGVITIGKVTTTTGNNNLQVGEVFSGGFTGVSPAGGAVVTDPVQIPSLGVTAAVQSAGTPSDFNLGAGDQIGVPIIAIPIKVQLTSATLPLGPSCFIGTDQNPIVLHPVNTDLSRATLRGSRFDANGQLDENGVFQSITVKGAVQGDNSFAVPGATGCGPNGDGSLDSAVNAVAGLPSPAGSNHLVLDNASSTLVLAQGFTGQQFASFWHVAFG